MSEDSKNEAQQKRNETFLREYEERVASGRPIITHVIEPPFQCGLENGCVNIDAPCMVAGGTNQAAVVRFSLTPAAAKGLRDYLNTLEFSDPAPGAGTSTGKH